MGERRRVSPRAVESDNTRRELECEVRNERKVVPNSSGTKSSNWGDFEGLGHTTMGTWTLCLINQFI